MHIRNLDKIFRPKRVALIGACDDQTQTGSCNRKMLEVFDKRGFTARQSFGEEEVYLRRNLRPSEESA